jgi:hypothetical protein
MSSIYTKYLKNILIISVFWILVSVSIPVSAQPLERYEVFGNIYYTDEFEPIPAVGIPIVIKNVYKGTSVTVFTNADGFYWFDMTTLPGGVHVGDLIRRTVMETDEDEIIGASITEDEVGPGDEENPWSAELRDIVDPSTYNLEIWYDYKFTYAGAKTVKAQNLKTDLIPDVNGKVYFTCDYHLRDLMSGNKHTISWNLKLYQQNLGKLYIDPQLQDFNDDEIFDREEVGTPKSGTMDINPPTQGQGFHLIATETISYTPPAHIPGEGNAVYMQLYADLWVSEIDPSGPSDNVNVLIINIGVQKRGVATST